MNDSFNTLCQLCSENTNSNEINSKSINWREVWKLALRHRVVPVIADRIKKLEITVPDDIAQLIAKNVKKNLYKGISHSAELVRLTKLFQSHNIPFIVFKGIALLKLSERELHQRHHGDIDILLADIDDLKKTDSILRKSGYQRLTLPNSLELNTAQYQHFLHHAKDVSYYNPNDKIVLELHFKLCHSNKLLPFSPKQLHQNRSEICIATTIIPVMNKRDHQFYLLVHGAVSRWFRLKWLCDLSLISSNGNDYLSDDDYMHAKSLGIDRMMTQGIVLAHKLLHMPISSAIKLRQYSNPTIKMLILFSKKNLMDQELFNQRITSKMLFWFKYVFIYMPALRESSSYKIDHFSYFLTDTSDWEVISFPPSLFFLYYLLRPFLWLKRQL